MLDLARSAKQLGTTLRRARRARAWTQTDLANRAGMRQGTVSHVENGLETVKLSTIMNLLRVLDLELVIQPRTKGSHDDIENLF